ncbi:glycosyltransferase family A protein [Sutcliffiella cohnii]|uniref:glycosyltransferase family 2 protein n=1 Tax=Sutcliffiella cohnii TaxID=33932 RepID=UPI002E1AC142|nr:glycosyltransferase family A protein [Sutcliffiella cohnii]
MQHYEKHRVSIIIPTFGRPISLKRAIDSVLGQSYKNYEILVVDDNDPETNFRKETEIVMRQYLSNEHITYIKHPKNQNGAAARNTGIKNSKGAFLCFLDDDDWYLPSKISMQVEFLLKNKKFAAVYCGWIKNGKSYKFELSGNLSRELLLMDYQPMTPTLMFRREVIEEINGFDISYKRHQDYELMLRFFEKNKISYVDQCLVCIGTNSGENNLKGPELEKLKNNFLKQFSPKISKLEEVEKGITKKIYSRHFAKVFLNHIKNRYYWLALKVLLRFIPYSPLNFLKEVLNNSIFIFKHKMSKVNNSRS